ncbi:Gfo/Idh/MocA family protein [Haladaptatus sp. DFWS20]|uniref:Gfo/Idh/MocA family protein n=1 Tax=Haladaptatus sp. DFWS20 TaxID=3403467 RepID=UPI003EBD270B
MSIRVGVLSAAHVHTDTYATFLAGMDDTELVGVADEDSERGQEAANRYGVEYLDTTNLLDSVDAAVVCSTNAAHGEWVQTAANAGVDVLCEKPLSTSPEDARAMITACKEADVKLGVAMPLRFSEPVRRAEAALAADSVGTLHTISGTNRGRMPGGWFTDPERAGGGAATDHTVHIVDLVHYLTGSRVAEVYAELGTRFHDIAVEDVNVLSMELEDGTQFILDGSWSRPDSWRTWGEAGLELHGNKGSICVNCFGQRLTHTVNAGENAGTKSVFWGTNPDEGLITDFIDAVRKDRPPKITGEEGVEAVAVVSAAYESSKCGEPVAVEY